MFAVKSSENRCCNNDNRIRKNKVKQGNKEIIRKRL